MPSIVDVVNKALTHLAVPTIASIDENSEAAVKAKQVLATVRDDTLREAAWKFATYIGTLATLSGETVPGWAYLFVYPPKAMMVRKVFEDTTTVDPDPVDWKEVISPSSNVRAIAANISPAYVEYTYQVTDPNAWDQAFIEAFAFKLAAILAHVLTGSTDIGTKMQGLYGVKISEAKRLNAQEHRIDKSGEMPSYVKARA
jgi:hypothetical protein